MNVCMHAKTTPASIDLLAALTHQPKAGKLRKKTVKQAHAALFKPTRSTTATTI